MESRGRIYQDTDFEVKELENRRIEQLLGFVNKGDPENQPIVVYLKAGGLSWQRFFLEAGIAFWEDWGKLIDEEDEDTYFVDYAKRFAVKGEIINSVKCINSCIYIGLQSEKKIILYFNDELDADESQIRISAPDD